MEKVLYLFVKPKFLDPLFPIEQKSNSVALLNTSIFLPASAASTRRAKQESMAKNLSSRFSLKPGVMAGVKSCWRSRWKSQRPVSLVGQCPLLVAATAALLRVVESLFGARDVGGHGGAQLRRRRVVLVVGKVLSRANKSCFLKAHRRRRFNGKSITAKSILPLTIPLE
jgi:hypothetical protein